MRRPGLTPLVLAFAVAAALAVAAIFAVLLVSVSSLRRSNERETRSKDVTAAALRLSTVVADLESGVRGYAATARPAFLAPYRSARGEWRASSAHLRRLVAGDHVQARRAAAADRLIGEYISDYAEPVIAIVALDRRAASSQISSAERKRRIDRIRLVLDRLLATEGARSADRARTADTVARRAVLAVVAALVGCALLVLLFGAWVAKTVTEPVRRVADAASAVAGGDLEVVVPERGAGEVGAVARAFNAMTRTLADGRRALLDRNSRLEVSERQKTELISMVSHELRTPLSSVLGFTHLLLTREFPPEQQRRYLEVVDTEAQRLAKLAEDFLDVRLLEEGRFDLDLADVELVTLVREQVLLYFANAPLHRVDLRVPYATVVVHADRNRLAQVIGNLFSNAIKYSPDGGEVVVEVTEGRGTARVAVTDPGLGIPAEQQDKVFDRFYRGGAPAAGITGAGIGLAVARDIVEAHGGTIAFRSTEGGGSTFWIELPQSSQAAA